MAIYNRKTPRLRDYDYSSQACYFITIVCHERRELFGCVRNGEMILNEAGRMVEATYNALGLSYKNVRIHSAVVMPNHIHLVVYISESGVSSLSEIVRWFKSKTTVEYIRGVRESGWPVFNGKLWQSRYYDHIIRTSKSYEKIVNYVSLNPERWSKDRLNTNVDDDYDDVDKMIAEAE